MLQKATYRLLLILTTLLAFGVSNSLYAHWSTSYLNSDSLRTLDEKIRRDTYGKVSSIIIYKGNRTIFEKYYGFSQISTLHPISSVTKSITSLAVGVCIGKGYIASVDTRIEEFFPDYQDVFDEDSLKKGITLRHLLNQTSGLEWDEWTIHYSYAGNPLIEMSHKEASWVDIILRLPIAHTPGDSFAYNSGLSEILKEIICRASGMKFKPFVEEHILGPLGITSYYWDSYPFNDHPAWGGLSLTTRDMAKIGILVLNNGLWRNEPVVSEEWIKESIAPSVNTPKLHYGLHWWVGHQPDGQPMVFAAGYGDQYVCILPDKLIVIAINGRNFTDHKWDKDHEDLINSIIRSIE